MDKKVETRIINVLSSVFEIPKSQITEKSSPDTIDSWDSLKHMNMVVALEEEFGIEFTDENIIELIDLKVIVAAVMDKLTA